MDQHHHHHQSSLQAAWAEPLQTMLEPAHHTRHRKQYEYEAVPPSEDSTNGLHRRYRRGSHTQEPTAARFKSEQSAFTTCQSMNFLVRSPPPELGDTDPLCLDVTLGLSNQIKALFQRFNDTIAAETANYQRHVTDL
mmetsp:Transcript_51887/g.105639  ORF Transcript_51887/g.105639 Transcript_51887/m.105639 type:complete len:137 (-) Transcript_51887:517-927(-)